MRKLIGPLLMMVLTLAAGSSQAASKAEIDARVKDAVTEFYTELPAGKVLASRAAAILVFPRVVKAGIGIGGEYGEGALLVKGKTAAYYNIAAGSVGLQLGAQVKSEVIMFMTADALAGFQADDGWEAGVDGSIAIVEFGAGGEIDTTSAQAAILGFIYSNKGLMYNLTFEGSKITRIKE